MTFICISLMNYYRDFVVLLNMSSDRHSKVFEHASGKYLQEVHMLRTAIFGFPQQILL